MKEEIRKLIEQKKTELSKMTEHELNNTIERLAFMQLQAESGKVDVLVILENSIEAAALSEIKSDNEQFLKQQKR